MAKLGLIFICVFLTVQVSLAARIVRDVDTAVKPEAQETNQFNLNDALAQISQGLQKALSKENVDKFMENLGETGEKLKEFGQGLIDKAQKTAAEFTKKPEGDKKE